LAILDQHWEHYNKFVEWTNYYFRYGWCSTKNEADWFKDISKTNWLPTIQNALVKPSEAFLDKPEIREVLGDHAPYLAIEIKTEDFIKAIDINAEANIEGVLNYLKVLVEQECDDKNKFEKLYNFLNNNYEHEINEVFNNHPVIYVPNTEKKFFTSHDVLWQDVSDIFGENRGYLEGHYHDLESFFVEKIGVSEKPSPKDYADVLVDLSHKDVIADEDEQIILKIYKELNHHLNPDMQEPISEEHWWDNFINKPIFFVKNKKFSNKENVFINDRQELYDLFKNEVNIAFLWLPYDYHPDKIKFFIEAARLRYLSEAEITPNFGGGSYLDESHTTQVQSSMPYIIRYLYWNEHSKYESLKKNGVFEEIANLEVRFVDKLQVEYIIQIHGDMPITPVTRTTDAQRCLLHNNKLYIPKEPEIDMDHAAIELSKMFGEIKGLDDFIISIFEKQTEAKIKNLMNAKRICELPEPEIKFLKGFFQPNIEAITAEPTEENNDNTTSGISSGEVPINVAEYKPKNGSSVTSSPEPSGRGYTQEPYRVSGISSEAAKSIGESGEKYALKCLMKEKREEYSDAEVKSKRNGFVIEKDGKTLVEVIWLNETGEQGVGRDIELIENNIKYYIEVKSTKTEEKNWFHVSKDQWALMQKEGAKFWIYRVYGAETDKPKLVKIRNPAKLWRDGDIIADPIKIQI
jgi:hypothetical protein